MGKNKLLKDIEQFEAHYYGPINTILNTIPKIDEKECTDPNVASYKNQIVRSSVELLRASQMMANHSRLSHGLYPHKYQCIDLVRFVRGIARVAAPYAHLNGAVLTYRLPPEPIITITEIEPLTAILGHLLSNACRFNAPNDVISIDLHRRDNTAFIMVWDRGTGIPESVEPYIFKPYYSYSHDGAPFAGNGLGLTLAKQFAKFLGGDLKYASNPPGCLFTLILPLRRRKRPRLTKPPIPKDAIEFIMCDAKPACELPEKNSDQEPERS